MAGRSARRGASVPARKSKAEPTIEELFLDGGLIDRAMRRGVREALRRHKQAGVAIVILRRGKVVRIPPDQIRIGAGRRDY